MTANKYRASAQERNRDYVDGIKVDGRCADCWGWFQPCAMDFDHVTGDKTRAISAMVQRGVALARLQEELEKCDLVCSNCHRVQTAIRRGEARRK